MSEDGLLQEIEDDLAKKRYEALWKKYGSYVIGFAVSIVLVTALVTGFKSYKISKEQRLTGDLLNVIYENQKDISKKIANIKSFADKEKGTSQAVLAKLQAGALAIEAGDKEKALSLYNEIATDDTIEPFFRQLGDLLVVQTNLDDGDPIALESRLSPLMKENCAWRYSAYEYAGYLALRVGDKEKAKKIFVELIALPNVPTDFIARSNDIVRMLSWGK